MRQSRYLNVLREMKLLQALRGLLRAGSGDVEKHHVSGFEDMDVAQHPALRREPCGIAAGAGSERRRVVGQQALQERSAIGAGHGNLPAWRDRAYYGAFMKGCVIVGRGHPRA